MQVEHVGVDKARPAIGVTARLSLVKRRILRDDMTRDGLIMVTAGLLTGLLNYLYQLSMSIMLSPTEFGELFSLFSLFMIVWLVSQSLQTPITKFVSTFKAQDNLDKVNYLWRLSLRKTLLIGVLVFIVIAAVSPLISRLLHTGNNLYVVLLFSSCILTFALPINYGVLRGLQRFMPLGFSNIIWALVRFLLALLLVHLGMGIYGGLLPVLLTFCVTFIVTTYFLRGLFDAGNQKVDLISLRSYTGFSLIALACFAVLTNIDVVLAKHYLSSDDAGVYAAVSVLGRIALFAPAGIAIAMFPKTSELYENGKPHRPLLRKGMAYVLLIGGAVVLFYLLFPGFISSFVLRDKYDFASFDLFKYGLAMLFFAISFLLINYLLSLNRTRKIALALLVAAALEVILICSFHSSISQVVNIILVSASVSLLVILSLFFKVKTKSGKL